MNITIMHKNNHIEKLDNVLEVYKDTPEEVGKECIVLYWENYTARFLTSEIKGILISSLNDLEEVVCSTKNL